MMVSIIRDLFFNYKCMFCLLVVLVEISLIVMLLILIDNVRRYKLFFWDVVMIEVFFDYVLVLGLLVKLWKLIVCGLDGKFYGLLIKFKDDLCID